MNEQNLDFNTIMEYIKENFIGLCLFLLAFFIIYFVDYVNYLNTSLYGSAPIVGIPGSPPINNLTKNMKKKSKK